MNEEQGPERFARWRANPQQGFVNRALVGWLQWRCGSTRRVTAMAMLASPAPCDLNELIASIFATMGVAPHAAPMCGREEAWMRALQREAIRGAARGSMPMGHFLHELGRSLQSEASPD